MLTHLAHQADSVARRLSAAIEGVVVDQYDDGRAQRDGGFEDGARRPASAIIDDLRASIEAVEGLFAVCPEAAWLRPVRSLDGPDAPASSLVALRWHEVELHHVDLDLGYPPDSWRATLVAQMRPSLIATPRERADSRAVLGWLVGRGTAPVPAPWD